MFSKKSVLSLVVLFNLPSAFAFAPPMTNVCQTQSNAFSQITVCSQQDDSSGQSYGFTVTYRNGLLNQSQQVVVGGVKSSNGQSYNLYDGETDYTNRPLALQADGSGAMGLPGGLVHAQVQLYFQIPGGAYDSNYGNNYVFQF